MVLEQLLHNVYFPTCRPAIWALGTNLPEVGWPACGEIDMMEQLFENHLMVQSAVHVAGRYGDYPALKQLSVSDVTENFHVYGMIWTEDKIDFTVDGEVFFTYQPTSGKLVPKAQIAGQVPCILGNLALTSTLP